MDASGHGHPVGVAQLSTPVLTHPFGALTDVPGPWVTRAACADPGVDPVVREVFTADAGSAWDQPAAAVCDRCPVLADCAAYAGSIRYLTGIWGGRRRGGDERGRRIRVG